MSTAARDHIETRPRDTPSNLAHDDIDVSSRLHVDSHTHIYSLSDPSICFAIYSLDWIVFLDTEKMLLFIFTLFFFSFVSFLYFRYFIIVDLYIHGFELLKSDT